MELNYQMFADANTQTTGGLSAEMKTYYGMELLENAKPKLVHGQFGQKKPIPRGSGKVAEWRKFSSLPPALTPLVEGVTPHAARQVTVHSSIPTLGIGSGSHTCDGDVVVIHDLVGAFPWFIPAFVKPRADVAGSMTAAVKEWMEDCYTEPGSISS